MTPTIFSTPEKFRAWLEKHYQKETPFIGNDDDINSSNDDTMNNDDDDQRLNF